MPFTKDLLKVQQTEFELCAGRILVSVPFYNDAFFNRSVVLLTDYGNDSVAGLILNHRLPYRVAQLVPELKVEENMFLGGPVQPEALFLIHNFDNCKDSYAVVPNIYVGYDQILLALIEHSAIPTLHYRFMMGYAGWSEGQLEKEIERNMWVVGNPTTDLVFKTPSENVWTRAVQTLGADYLDWLRVSVNLSSN